VNDPQPPVNLEAEKALLGACLQSGTALDEASEVIHAADFYRPIHSTIFTACTLLAERGEPSDAVTVAGQLQRDGNLMLIGGAPYLLTLIEAMPSASNARYYAEQVAEAATRRRLLETGQRAMQHAGSSGDVDEAVQRVRADLDALSDNARSTDGSDIGVLAADAIARYGSPVTGGLPTPWHDLNDNLNGGLRPGTLTVVGARPGVGKSVMGLQLCLHVAQSGFGALFLSLEMPEQEVADRIVSALASVSYSKILSHSLEDNDWARIETAVDKLAGMALRIVDKPYMTLAAIRTLARSFARNSHGLGVLVVDYIQLMQPAETRTSRQEQVASFSRGLKLLAKELGVPVVTLAQLNRGSEQRTDKKPTMSDLRESGSIEQDADHVMLLHRDDEDETRIGEIDVLLVKNRGGRTGTITLGWAAHFQQVRSLAVAGGSW
jgi:replicative DNA helicase